MPTTGSATGRATSVPPVRLSDFGASFGGPLERNRTFFFLSYEGMRMRQPGYWRTAVPTLAARAALPDWVQPALGLFPAPNGPVLGAGLAEWTGRNNQPSRLDVGSARIDHAVFVAGHGLRPLQPDALRQPVRQHADQPVESELAQPDRRIQCAAAA